MRLGFKYLQIKNISYTYQLEYVYHSQDYAGLVMLNHSFLLVVYVHYHLTSV